MGWWPAAGVFACVALAACGEPTLVDRCTDAVAAKEPAAGDLCELAFQKTGSMEAAVGGATIALFTNDKLRLHEWTRRAPPTIEGARILHFWGDLRRREGHLKDAEVAFRRALQLRIDRDPLRATNSALMLIEIVRSRSADETVTLARIAWEQATRAKEPEGIAYAASTLVELFVEIGELHVARSIANAVPLDPRYESLRDLNSGRLLAASSTRSREPAATHFRQVMEGANRQWDQYLDAASELAPLLLSLGRLEEAREVVAAAHAAAQRHGAGSTDAACRLFAASAMLALATRDHASALVDIERGLALDARHGARVQLLNLKGEALQMQGRVADAERVWRDAADSLESWRASLPSSELRAGLVLQHRRALESWLDSAGRQAKVDDAITIVQRLVGRSLLDRIAQPDAKLPDVSPDEKAPAAIRAIERRLAARRSLVVVPGTRSLRDAPHDFHILAYGRERVWALRKRGPDIAVTDLGPRVDIDKLVEAYRRDVSNERVANQLGAILFPASELPERDQPIAVILDASLADLPLAALRIEDEFLIERVPILEVPAPDLLFASADSSGDTTVVVGDPLGDLPGARREAEDVAKRFGIAPQLGERATRQAVLAARDAGLLHMATHSEVSGGEAVFRLHGGELSSIDLIQVKLAPRLAILATCRSQAGEDPARSLAAAFLASGTRGVVAVKHPLDDATSRAIIQQFYDAGGASNPLVALARAQRAASKTLPPTEWAAFSFYGVGGWLLAKKG